MFILDKGNRITFYVEDAIGELRVEVIIVTFLEAVASETVLTACNNDVKLSETRTVHDRTGTSVDDSARKSNNRLDQWQSGKLGTGSRV